MRFMDGSGPRAAQGWRGFVLCLLCSGANAEVIVRDHELSYEVQGRTLQSLREELRAKGPMGQDGRHLAGLTAVELEWEAAYEQLPDGCRVVSHRVELDITTTLPRWLQRSSAPIALRRRWDRAATAIAEHEAGHREIAVQSAHALAALVAGFSSPSRCVRAATELEWQAWKLQRALQGQQDRFDRVTGSGTARGAVL